MASVALDDLKGRASPRRGLGEYSRVRLMGPLTREGVALTAGAEGVIVHDHADGSFSVEFEKPDFEVVTVYATELRAVA